MLKGNFDISLDFLRAKTPPMIGVDISSSSVKLVELGEVPKGTGYVVERYAIEALPVDAVKDGNINNLDEVAETIKRAWKRMGTRVKNVSLALPSSAVITKIIQLPADLREEDMEYQVESEANQYLPFAIEDVNLDFQVLGSARSSPNEVEVLLAASKKENVEDRVACAQVAGLKALVIDSEPYSSQIALAQICEQLPEKAKDQCVALVDIGAYTMSVNVIRNGQSVYSRDLQIGGAQLTQQIQAQFGMSLEEAEAAKRSGNLPENYERDLLTPFCTNIATEIQRVFQFFFTNTPYSEVDYIVLAGGSAVLPGLDEVVATRTQVGALIANPFEGMTVSTRIKPRQLQIDAPALMIACGLAMRRFDPV